MQELSLDRCLYLFEDCRFDVFFRTAGTHTYYCFYFVYLSLFGVLVSDCYLLNAFLQQLLKRCVFRGSLFWLRPTPVPLWGHSLWRVLPVALGWGAATGPVLLGMSASPSGVLFSPNGPESFLLAVGPAESVMGTSFAPVLCRAPILFHPRAAGSSGDLRCP